MAGYHKGTHFQRPDPLQKESVNRATRHRVWKKQRAAQNEELLDIESLDEQSSCTSLEVDESIMGSTHKETEHVENEPSNLVHSYDANQGSSTTSVDTSNSDCAQVWYFESLDFEERLFVPLQDIPEN